MLIFDPTSRGISKLSTPGHVYFIQAEGGGPIKIGWATDPAKRLAGMQPHSPLKLVLVFSEPGNGREEAELHEQFAKYRLHGEWFEPASEILREIEIRRGRNEPKTYIAAAPPLEPISFDP